MNDSIVVWVNILLYFSRKIWLFLLEFIKQMWFCVKIYKALFFLSKQNVIFFVKSGELIIILTVPRAKTLERDVIWFKESNIFNIWKFNVVFSYISITKYELVHKYTVEITYS